MRGGTGPIVSTYPYPVYGAGFDPRLLAIVEERIGQYDEFPPGLDDALTPPEWIARLTKHLGRAVTQDPDVYRREMVIVGALALAAIEAHDRRYP